MTTREFPKWRAYSWAKCDAKNQGVREHNQQELEGAICKARPENFHPLTMGWRLQRHLKHLFTETTNSYVTASNC